MNEIRQLYEAGWTRRQIADKLSLSYGTVCAALRKEKFPAWPHMVAQKNTIATMLSAGMKPANIADALGISRQRTYILIKEITGDNR